MGDRIFDVGAAGLDGSDAKVKALMNNIVNSQTPGYRKSDVVIKSFPTYLDEAKVKSSTQVPQVEGMHYNQSPGTLLRTGNSTDLSLGGEGFFEVATPSGLAYTRDGRFTLDQNGRLLTIAGNYPVEGNGGPIVINPGTNAQFTNDGKVMVDDVEINSVKIVNFKDPSALKSITGALFKAERDAQMELNQNPRILSGYVEASNVNIIEEYMNMIYLNRLYSLDSKIVTNRDLMLTRALDMGKPVQ